MPLVYCWVVIWALLCVEKCRAAALDEWIAERFVAQRSIAGIFESTPLGLRYFRGFPRGIWGTSLAPDLGAYDEGNKQFLVDGNPIICMVIIFNSTKNNVVLSLCK